MEWGLVVVLIVAAVFLSRASSRNSKDGHDPVVQELVLDLDLHPDVTIDDELLFEDATTWEEVFSYAALLQRRADEGYKEPARILEFLIAKCHAYASSGSQGAKDFLNQWEKEVQHDASRAASA